MVCLQIKAKLLQTSFDYLKYITIAIEFINSQVGLSTKAKRANRFHFHAWSDGQRLE